MHPEVSAPFLTPVRPHKPGEPGYFKPRSGLRAVRSVVPHPTHELADRTEHEG